MTDLEMTRLCAEAMGAPAMLFHSTGLATGHSYVARDYDPLHDDAQAMALVKRFEITLSRVVRNLNEKECMWYADCGHHGWTDSDLNRAIVECVAKMQQAKTKAVTNG